MRVHVSHPSTTRMAAGIIHIYPDTLGIAGAGCHPVKNREDEPVLVSDRNGTVHGNSLLADFALV